MPFEVCLVDIYFFRGRCAHVEVDAVLLTVDGDTAADIA
jgi:hypothetical protein